MTQTKTRKPNGVDVTTDWDGTTAVGVTVPEDNYTWFLDVTISGITTQVEFSGPLPKR
jgi:flagellar hook assembly protein FlgD